jgi:hypothetical protein
MLSAFRGHFRATPVHTPALKPVRHSLHVKPHFLDEDLNLRIFPACDKSQLHPLPAIMECLGAVSA